jgi:hypothetical protein
MTADGTSAEQMAQLDQAFQSAARSLQRWCVRR